MINQSCFELLARGSIPARPESYAGVVSVSPVFGILLLLAALAVPPR
jgi:hypothetical protein